MKRTHSLLAGAIVLAAGAPVLFAGPLDPPAGPVASTGKTLAEIEPRIAVNPTNTPGDADSIFKISQPGSYYLTGNITGAIGKHGVEITASGVTLDLNGFDLAGVPAMGSFDAVSATEGSLSNITVSNGSVRGWGRHGIDLGTFGPANCRVERVLARGNVGHGIHAGGGGTVSDCVAHNNTQTGIVGLTVLNCTASVNAVGINATIVSNCVAYLNTANGIGGTTITDCVASNNAIGFRVGGTITNCTAIGNGTGFLASSYQGPPFPASVTISNCTATLSAADGFSVEDGCIVVNCSAIANYGNGIACTSRCTIRDNNCAKNGYQFTDHAGILATGTNNRIEGNNCTGAYRGIRVDGANNVIIRNTCSDNSLLQWTIAADNYYGPIIDRAGVVTPSVSGSAAPGTLASTDPNANFSN